MKDKLAILTLLTFFLLLGCNKPKAPVEEGGYESSANVGRKAMIISRSGELFDSIPYLPFPLNHALYYNQNRDSLDVLILGKPIPDDFAYFMPFGLLDFSDEGQVRVLLLALPEDEKYMSLPNTSFTDFMIRNSSIKTIIDTYLSNYKGLGKTKVLKWRDDLHAREFLFEFETRHFSTNKDSI